MTFLKFAWCVGIAAVLSHGSTFAQIAPAEQLLPDDTIGLVTIPDWKKFTANISQSPYGQLWNDPAMKQFRENFNSNFQADFLKPLEKELGIKLADYQDLLQGQITLALTTPASAGGFGIPDIGVRRTGRNRFLVNTPAIEPKDNGV